MLARSLRHTTVLTLVAALVIAGALARSAVAASPAAAKSAERYAVGVRTKVFVDHTRSTPADVVAGIVPSASRRLATTIYYPARGKPDGRVTATTTAAAAISTTTAAAGAKPATGKFPLVLFSPGAPGLAKDYEPLLADWAAAGYVVAANEFPISSLAGPDDAAWKDLPAQTKDARFVLGRVLDLDATKAGIAAIDDDHIAAAGHSFGGATALSLVSNCCRDDRVDAAVVLSGVTETVDGSALRGARGSVLFVHGRNDRAVSYREALEACAAVKGTKRFLTVEELRGVPAHVDPYVGVSKYAAMVRPAIVDFLDGYVQGGASARARLDRTGEGTTMGAISRCRAVPTSAVPAD